MAAGSDDIPWHFTARKTEFRYCSRRSANGEVIQENYIKIGSEKLLQEGLLWPLHEGREIWGADGTFASIKYDMRTSRAASAPSTSELAWFYTGFRQSAWPGAFPRRVSFTDWTSCLAFLSILSFLSSISDISEFPDSTLISVLNMSPIK